MRFSRHFRSIPSGVKASFAFFLASLVTKGVSYITTPIFTRLLSPEEFGQSSVFLTWFSLLGIVAMFCLSYGVFNIGMLEYPGKRDEYSFSMLGLSCLITFIFSCIFLGGFSIFKPYLGFDFPLAVLMCTLFFLQPGYMFWLAHQRYEWKYKASTFWIIFTAALSSVVAIVAIYLFPNHKLYARLFGAKGVLAVVYAGFCIYIALKNRFCLNVRYWKQALLFNLPLIPHYLSSYLLSGADKLMISRMVNASATAYYTIAYSVAAVILIIWTAAHDSLRPFIYENCKTHDYSAISNVTLPILAVFGSGCILLILLAPEVISLMATHDYQEAVFAIPPVVVGVFFQVHYFLYADILYYFKKPRYVMLGSLFATGANLLLNYLFIPIWGYMAAAYTTLFCYLLQAGIDYWAMKHVVRVQVYNMKLIVALSTVMCAISLVCLLVYKYSLIRYALLSALILLLLYQRRHIIDVLAAFKRKPARS